MVKGKKIHALHIKTQFLRTTHKDFVTWLQLALSFLATFSSTKTTSFSLKVLCSHPVCMRRILC